MSEDENSKILDLLNPIALLGWIYLAYLVVTEPDLSSIFTPLYIFEGICIIEVMRIALGNLPGSLLFGCLLHIIRVITITQIIPNISEDDQCQWIAKAILGSWVFTEISRYPMYVYRSEITRKLRMVVPVVTFPIGCFTEAYGALVVFREYSPTLVVKVLLLFVALINGVLGPYMAYPHVLKKGLKAFQKGDEENKNK